MLSLRLTGVASLADRVAIISSVTDKAAHELRHLDLDAEDLVAKPTVEDVARIDVQGALAGASASLQLLVDVGGPGSQVASAALERLYVEALRFDSEVGR